MEFPLPIEGFQGQNLTVRAAGYFSGPKLCLNGQPLKNKKGIYLLRDNSGKEYNVKLRYNYVDPVPSILIEDRLVRIADPLKGHEYTWIAWPLLLAFIGGVFGGLCGGWAMYTNSRIFRGQQKTSIKYLLTTAILFLAIMFFLFSASVVLFFFNPYNRS